MNIEELVKKQLLKRFFTADDIATAIRNALTEQAETHAIELRAYEATVQNLEQRIREMEAQMVPDGWKLVPVEPTQEMVCAAEEAHMPFGDMDLALRMAILSAPDHIADAAPKKDAERPDCGTCANRGRVKGLSQETFCEHCLWSEQRRKNHYKPTAIAGDKK